MRTSHAHPSAEAQHGADLSRNTFTGGDPIAPARGLLIAVLATCVLLAIAGAGLWIGATQLTKVSRIEQETLLGSSFRSIRTASAEAAR